jgi:putative ABC transport system substrate-binding protein
MRRRDFIALFGGVAAAWPLAARAQQPDRKRRVAVLMSTASDDPAEIQHLKVFVEALSRLGWIEGRNLDVMSRWGDGEVSRMIANAREVVGTAPDAILVKGANVPAARQATSTIPIVFVVLSDAIALECVGSFARPTGNLTGFTSYESALVGKRLTLLREMSPGIVRALYLRSQLTGTDTSGLFVRLSEDARTLQMPVIDGPADNDADIERTILSLAREPNSGLIVAFDAFTVVHQAKIVELAARLRLPAIYPFRGFPQSGGLFSYGFDQDEQFRQAASYIARILAGEKPADLPVQTPIRFELVINLKTAKTLGIEPPAALIARADEVIE